MRAVLAAGKIPTARGSLKMNANQFTIQNIYLGEAVKDADGVVTTKVTGTVFTDHADSYASQCKFWSLLPASDTKLLLAGQLLRNEERH